MIFKPTKSLLKKSLKYLMWKNISNFMRNQENLRKKLVTIVGRVFVKFYIIFKILLSVCASVYLCAEHILVKFDVLFTTKIS